MKDHGITIIDGNPVQLYAGGFPRVELPVVILSGQGALIAGTVLGKVTMGAASSAAKTGGNTGNGALTLDATTPILTGAKPGVYTVRCIAAATNSGTFRVTDPDGFVLGDIAVAGTFSNKLKFVIADGGTDFIVGDGFDITIAAGSGKFVAYDDDAVDGSGTAVCILADDIDATSEDINTSAYYAGWFNEAALTGLDAAAKKDFEGSPVFFGSLV